MAYVSAMLSTGGPLYGFWAAGVRREVAIGYPMQRQLAELEHELGRHSLFSALGAATRLRLAKHSCRSTKTLPATDTNLLLVLVDIMESKKLVVNMEVSFSSISPFSRCYPPSQCHSRQGIVWGVGLGRMELWQDLRDRA